MPKVLTNAEAVRASVLKGAKYEDGSPVARHVPAPRVPAPADKIDRVLAKLDALPQPAPVVQGLDDSRIVAALESLKESMSPAVENSDQPRKPLELAFHVTARDSEGRVTDFIVSEVG